MFKSISKTVYKVSDFLSWQRGNSLILSPSFQRRAVWPQGAKSFLIDTVVKGLPVPIIFLREQTDLETLEARREVIDGQQRLRTLIAFIDSASLKDFNPHKDVFTVKRSHNKDIAGRSFNELDSAVRKRILDYDFSVHILPSNTEDRDVLQIFARMNSTGVKLNPQELRNAEYYGLFKQLSYQLAYEQLNRWRKWEVFTEQDIARMKEVEETSELFRMMLEGVQGKSQPALDKLYKNLEESFPQSDAIERRFHSVMNRIDETVGDILPHTEFSRKVLFHTLYTFYYDMMYGLDSGLKKVTPKPIDAKAVQTVKEASRLIKEERLPDNLSKVLRGATGNAESRRERLSFLKTILQSA